MTKIKITGKTKVSVKKQKKKYIGGKGDGAFISGKILTTVKKKKPKANSNAKS